MRDVLCHAMYLLIVFIHPLWFWYFFFFVSRFWLQKICTYIGFSELFFFCSGVPYAGCADGWVDEWDGYSYSYSYNTLSLSQWWRGGVEGERGVGGG